MAWSFSARGPKQKVRLEATRFAKKHADEKYAPFENLPELERRAARKTVAPEVAAVTRMIHFICAEIDWCGDGTNVNILATGDTIRDIPTIDDLSIVWDEVTNVKSD